MWRRYLRYLALLEIAEKNKCFSTDTNLRISFFFRSNCWNTPSHVQGTRKRILRGMIHEDTPEALSVR